jgi:MYXO-CTERM domain-containing protein
LIGGQPSDSSQNYVVRLSGVGGSSCTGTLLTPTLVLTAQHCLTNGAAFSGGGGAANSYKECALGTNPEAASSLQVTLGNLQVGTNVNVARVFVDVDNIDCTSDIAMLELSSPVTGMTQHPLLLDSTIPVGTELTSIGWGLDGSQDAGYITPAQREQESGAVQLAETAGNAVCPDGTPADIDVPGFVVVSIPSCSGDSGSSLFTAAGNLGTNGAIAAVTSGGVSSKVALINGEEKSLCEDAVTVASPLDSERARTFIEQVYQSTGIMPWRVGQAGPPADVGGTCKKNNDCNSNFCVLLGSTSAGYCSKPCTTNADCSADTSCVATGKAADAGTANVCLPAQSTGSKRGCSVAPEDGASGDGWWMAGALVGGFGWRRRRNGRRA